MGQCAYIITTFLFLSSVTMLSVQCVHALHETKQVIKDTRTSIDQLRQLYSHTQKRRFYLATSSWQLIKQI